MDTLWSSRLSRRDSSDWVISISGAISFRELRSQRYSTALRIVYAYDPHRDAVLIIGGDKTGNSRFYEEITPKAEKIWKQYLRERAEEEAREKFRACKSSGTAQSKGRKPRGH